MQSIESMIEVLEGYKAGKKIQYRHCGLNNNTSGSPWTDYPPPGSEFEKANPAWNFTNWEYRLKPERKTAKPGIVLCLYKDGITHAYIDSKFDKENTTEIGYRHIGHFMVAEGDKF